MSHIFISYSRKDTKVVEQFVESLRKQDFIVWQDVSNISAGDQWHQALLDAIDQTAAVLVFWSQAASHSQYVKEELDRAIQQGKRIIPVWLDKNTPLRHDIASFNAIESKGFAPSAVQKIVTAVLEIAPRIQRLLTKFDVSLPMNAKKIKGMTRTSLAHRSMSLRRWCSRSTARPGSLLRPERLSVRHGASRLSFKIQVVLITRRFARPLQPF